jgi:hypothetical protein
MFSVQITHFSISYTHFYPHFWVENFHVMSHGRPERSLNNFLRYTDFDSKLWNISPNLINSINFPSISVVLYISSHSFSKNEGNFLTYFDSTQTKKIRTFLMDMMAMSTHSCYIYIQKFPQISVVLCSGCINFIWKILLKKSVIRYQKG